MSEAAGAPRAGFGFAPPFPRPSFFCAGSFAGVSAFSSDAVSSVSLPSASISTRSYAWRFSFARLRRCFCVAIDPDYARDTTTRPAWITVWTTSPARW